MVFHKEIELELEKANKKFPDYHSYHEGYAVLKEEIEEMKECQDELEYLLDMYWRAIRCNNVKSDDIHNMINVINNLAKELIQVSAVLVRHEKLFNI